MWVWTYLPVVHISRKLWAFSQLGQSTNKLKTTLNGEVDCITWQTGTCCCNVGRSESQPGLWGARICRKIASRVWIPQHQLQRQRWRPEEAEMCTNLSFSCAFTQSQESTKSMFLFYKHMTPEWKQKQVSKWLSPNAFLFEQLWKLFVQMSLSTIIKCY